MEQTKTIARILFTIYLMIATLIGLVMTLVASAQLVNAGLKTWVFPAADVPSYIENCSDQLLYKPVDTDRTDEEIKAICEERRAQQFEDYGMEKARDAVQNLAVLIVGVPLFILHYRLFAAERKEAKKDAKKKAKK